MTHTLKIQITYPDTMDDGPFIPTFDAKDLAFAVRVYIERGMHHDGVLGQTDSISVTVDDD